MEATGAAARVVTLDDVVEGARSRSACRRRSVAGMREDGLAAVREIITTVQAQIGALETTLEEQIASLRGKIESALAQGRERDAAQLVTDGRITTLEGKVSELQTQLADLAEKHGQLLARFNGHRHAYQQAGNWWSTNGPNT